MQRETTVTPVVAETGRYVDECPVWSASEKALYWLDLTNQLLQRYAFETERFSSVKLPKPVNVISLRAGGGLIAASIDGFSLLDPASGRLTDAASPPWSADEMPNDGKCDAFGRFWVGTKDARGGLEAGSVYCLEPNGSARRVATGFGNVNGIDWSPDRETMYLTDTRRSEIYGYAFGLNGSLDRRRTLVTVPAEFGRPDGLAVAADGSILSANWMGGCLIRYESDGSLADVIRVSSPCPTSCAFGGDDLSHLFVTTASDLEAPVSDTHAPWTRLIILEGQMPGMTNHMFAG